MSWNQSGYNTNWSNWGGKQSTYTPNQPQSNSNNPSQVPKSQWTWADSGSGNNSWGANNSPVQPISSAIWQYSNQWPQSNQQNWSQNNQGSSAWAQNANSGSNNSNIPSQNNGQTGWNANTNANNQSQWGNWNGYVSSNNGVNSNWGFANQPGFSYSSWNSGNSWGQQYPNNGWPPQQQQLPQNQVVSLKNQQSSKKKGINSQMNNQPVNKAQKPSQPSPSTQKQASSSQKAGEPTTQGDQFNPKLCKLCFSAESTMMNRTCRHLMMCGSCYFQYRNSKGGCPYLPCPLCKTNGEYIEYIAPIFS